MKQRLAPLTFTEEDFAAARAERTSVVAPARPSPGARQKAHTKKTAANHRATSFQSLMKHLAQLEKVKLTKKDLPGASMSLVPETLTGTQKKAFRLLGVSYR